MDVSEALKLLSGDKAFQSPLVRKYAVDVLRNASDDELLLLLLQLVQALRYEPSESTGLGGEAGERAIEEGDDEDGTVVVSAPQSGADTEGDGSESEEDAAAGRAQEGDSVSSLSPLGAFLVERACASTAGG